MGGAHVPGGLRRALGEFLTQVPQGELNREVSSQGYDSRASGFPEWKLQRVTAVVGDGGQGKFRHGEYLQDVGVTLVEWCAHLY